MADEEAFLVVVGVDEPAGDPVGTVATDFAAAGVEDIHAADLQAQPAVGRRQDNDVRLAEDDEEVALAGVLEVFGHVEVGVHAGLEHGDAAQLAELRGVRFVVEGAGDEHIEPGIARLPGGGDEVGPADGAELGADDDGGALFRVAFPVMTLGADHFTRPGSDRGEGDPIFLVGLLHAGGLEVFEDHLLEGAAGGVVGAVFGQFERVDQLVVLVHAQHAGGGLSSRR